MGSGAVPGHQWGRASVQRGGWAPRGKHWVPWAAGDGEAPPSWAVVLHLGIRGGRRVSREGAGARRAQRGPLFPAALGLILVGAGCWGQ